MKQVTHPDREASFVTGAYSDGIIANGFLFVSGQASVDFKTSKFMLGTVEDETHRTMQNLKTIIESVGGSMEKVVKCTVHLANIADFSAFNKVYSEYFPGTKPARTTVQSLMAENIKVEVDCIVDLS